MSLVRSQLKFCLCILQEFLPANVKFFSWSFLISDPPPFCRRIGCPLQSWPGKDWSSDLLLHDEALRLYG